MTEANGYSKEQQLARGDRRYRRKVASPKAWQRIIDAKEGPCRCCKLTGLVEYHHLVPRAIGGSDAEDNIVPLCRYCHQLVTERDRRFCALLRANLSDAEYAYAADLLGDARFDDRYPVEYRSVS